MARRVVPGSLVPTTGMLSRRRPALPSCRTDCCSLGRLLRLLSVVMLFVPALSAEGRSDDEVMPVWRLMPGQKFTVESTVHRVTTIQVGDVDTHLDVTDRVVLQYLVARHDNRGAAYLDARIKSMERTHRDQDGNETTRNLVPERHLKVPALTVIVNGRDGDIRIPAGASVFRSDAPQAWRTLGQMCRDGVFESWFDLPFRFPVITEQLPFGAAPPVFPRPSADDGEEKPAGEETGDDADEDSGDQDGGDEESDEATPEKPRDPSLLWVEREWMRTQSVALGPAAAIRWQCVYRIESIDDFRAQIGMSATSEVIARGAGSSGPLEFEQLQVTASDVTGSGSLQMDELSGLPKSMEMNQQMQLEGSGQVLSGDQTHELHFKQSLTQTWIASEFSMRDIQQGVPLQRVR